MAENYFSKLMKRSFQKCSKPNTFLKETVTAWIHINDARNINISNRILWNNENILIENKTVFRKQWFQKGIKHISDIYGFRTKEFYTSEMLKELNHLIDKTRYFSTTN